MAVLGNSFPDLIDQYKQMDGKGDYVAVIEILNEMNPILDDALAMECNSGTQHRTSVRGGLPAVSWGKLYSGIPNSKSTFAQVTDTTGFCEGLSIVDSRLLDINKNKNAIRLSEARGYLEALSQEVAEKMFYGNTATDPEEFMGLAPRFNSTTAANGSQIIDAGGTGSDNTSIWFLTWDDDKCHVLYPEGSMAGVERSDKGEQNVTDAQGNTYFAMMEEFRWHVGLTVKDWRYVTRVANIDVSDMQAGSVKLYDFLSRAYYQNWYRRTKMGKAAIYCNRDTLEALDNLARNAGASDSFIRLRPMEIQGEEVLMYRGIPIREVDAIVNTESRVV